MLKVSFADSSKLCKHIVLGYTTKTFNCVAFQRITSIYAAEKIFDTLSIEKGNGLILANWTNSIYAQLLTVAERAMAVRTENDYMKRVKGGKFYARVMGEYSFHFKWHLKSSLFKRT